MTDSGSDSTNDIKRDRKALLYSAWGAIILALPGGVCSGIGGWKHGNPVDGVIVGVLMGGTFGGIVGAIIGSTPRTMMRRLLFWTLVGAVLGAILLGAFHWLNDFRSVNPRTEADVLGDAVFGAVVGAVLGGVTAAGLWTLLRQQSS